MQTTYIHYVIKLETHKCFAPSVGIKAEQLQLTGHRMPDPISVLHSQHQQVWWVGLPLSRGLSHLLPKIKHKTHHTAWVGISVSIHTTVSPAVHIASSYNYLLTCLNIRKEQLVYTVLAHGYVQTMSYCPVMGLGNIVSVKMKTVSFKVVVTVF